MKFCGFRVRDVIILIDLSDFSVLPLFQSTDGLSERSPTIASQQRRKVFSSLLHMTAYRNDDKNRDGPRRPDSGSQDVLSLHQCHWPLSCAQRVVRFKM